jgi:hypothetical protein
VDVSGSRGSAEINPSECEKGTVRERTTRNSPLGPDNLSPVPPATHLRQSSHKSPRLQGDGNLSESERDSLTRGTPLKPEDSLSVSLAAHHAVHTASIPVASKDAEDFEPREKDRVEDFAGLGR